MTVHRARRRLRLMGALPSRFKKKSSSSPSLGPSSLPSMDWGWTGPPGEHSPYPTDPAPYPGYEISYCFVDIMANYQVLDNKLNLGPTAVSTNIDDYLGELEACYREGYHLNTHLRVPGVRNTMEVEDWGVKTPYQAILSKPLKSPDASDDWELRVEKCILSTRLRAFDALEGENDILRTIQKYSEMGGRLRCAVPVGYVRSHTSNNQYSVMGMELFFNMPKTQTKDRFTYHAIKMPVKYYVGMDATQTVQQVNCDSDFLGQMTLFLNHGWKLVDICMDTMALTEAFRMSNSTKYVDTMWIFEKDQANLNDTTPLYEGVILEYLHKVKKLRSREYPCRDWRPVIAGMGVMGWELAAIIQTPVLVQTGFTTYTLKMLMIYQRKLVPSFERLRNMKSSSKSEGFPTGSTLKPSQPDRRGSVYQARGKSDNETGYYHQTLKKYIYSNDSSIGSPLCLQTHITSDPRSGAVPRRASYVTPPRHLQANGFLPQGAGKGCSASVAYPPTYTEAMTFNNT